MSEGAQSQAWHRKWMWAAILLIGLIIVGLFWLIGPGPLDFNKGTRVSVANFHAADPTGVPASLVQAPLVRRGEYLAKAADCLVCHTARGGGAFAGGLAFQLPFGTIYSTNITPDKKTGIGEYTDAQFLAAVRGGIRRDGAHLYPAMPFTSYSYMTDADALAIKAYLFSLEPLDAPAPSNRLAFPFNQRWAVGIWSAMFNANRRFEPNAEQSADWNRGAYIAEALAHCGECHTPRNLAFALNNRRKFGGAITAGWHAYNISSDSQTGVGAWNDSDLLAYISRGHALGHGTAAGPMGEAVDESFSGLDPSDVRALVVYLKSVPGTLERGFTTPVAQAAPASHREGVDADHRGKVVYEAACASCHGWSGESPLTQYATLTGARAVNDPHGTNAAQIVINGMKRTTPEGITQMPAFGEAYSDQEIADVVNFVTGRFGSVASTLDAAGIAKLRRQAAN